MIVMAASGLISFILFTLAVVRLTHASAMRPSQLRAAYSRSPQGYAFHHQRAMIRRQGWLCALAGLMTLGICLVMGCVQLAYSAE